MSEGTSQIVTAAISGGKWFILLPLRVVIAILNIIPTLMKTYTTIHRSQFGHVTASYKVICTNPVHLGHLLVAWIRGDVRKAWVFRFRTIQEEDELGGGTEMIEDERYSIRGIDTERLGKIIEDCKIW